MAVASGRNLMSDAVGQRLRHAILAMTVTLTMFVVLVPSDLPVFLRSLIFIPALLGAVGGFSALYRT